MKKKIFGVEKNVFVLGLVSFFNDFSSEMVASAFPAFFTSVLRSGAGALGLVEGVADALSNFVKIYSGRLSDKIKQRKIFAVIGYSVSTLSRPFYTLTSSVLGVGGLRFLDRVGKGLRDSPRDALISLSVPREELGRSFGYHRAMDTVGGILGPLTAFLILEILPTGFNTLFITAFIVGLAAIATLFFVSDKILDGQTANEGDGKAFSKRFIIYIISVFILGAGGIPVAVLLLKTKDLGLSIGAIPLLYAVYNLSFAAFSWNSGKAALQFGHRNVLVAGYAVLLFGYFLLNQSVTVPLLIAAFVVLGVHQALTDGIHRAYAARLTDANKRGAAYGYLSFATGMGALFAGAALGFVWEKFSSGLAFSLASVFIVVGLISFLISQYKQT
ncbi:MAG: Major facilitator superfamily [Parcubacteria group bacterium GW2011_GWB1_44_7]|nr:MAG: Major facilitator superfamily [Parcubacteria group bacterium GW2011_GWB1_44_7]